MGEHCGCGHEHAEEKSDDCGCGHEHGAHQPTISTSDKAKLEKEIEKAGFKIAETPDGEIKVIE